MPLISSIHFSTVIVAIVCSFHERRTRRRDSSECRAA
jgi:hypothetical protein